MCRTPSLEATHVVPHKKHTTTSARVALLLVPFCRKARELRKEAWRVMATTPFNASLTLRKEKPNLFRMEPQFCYATQRKKDRGTLAQ
jgi:hypothetical protein